MSRKSSPSFAPESFRCCQKPTAEWYVNTGGIEHWQVIVIPSLYSNFCYDTTYMILCKDMYLPLYPWAEWFGCPYKTLCSACFFLSPKLLSACQLSPYIGFFKMLCGWNLFILIHIYASLSLQGMRTPFFLILNNIPLSGCTSIYLFTLLMNGILIAQKFWQLWIKPL